MKSTIEMCRGKSPDCKPNLLISELNFLPWSFHSTTGMHECHWKYRLICCVLPQDSPLRELVHGGKLLQMMIDDWSSHHINGIGGHNSMLGGYNMSLVVGVTGCDFYMQVHLYHMNMYISVSSG